MRAIIGLWAILLVFPLVSATAGDLYILKIDNPKQLEYVKENIEFAYGNINGKFLADLTPFQAELLRAGGVTPELILSDFNPSRTAVVCRVNSSVAPVAELAQSVYRDGENFIVAGTSAEMESLRKSGYSVVSLEGKRTPFFYHSEITAKEYLDSYPSDTLANLIVEDSLYSYDTRLEAFRTRYIHTDSIIAARDWIVAKFQEFGYAEVYYDIFYYNGTPCHNVICVKPGTAEPDKVIVIGGHYDSINSQTNPMIFAPGADDNGSGTAATLELARILSLVETRKTVIFIAFSAEEVGLIGSNYAASNLYYDGTDIECMLNFDMVAYTNDATDDVIVYSGPFRGYAQAVMDAYTRLGELVPVYGGSAQNSDHASFVNYGFHAAYIEEGDFNTPGWHTDIDISTRLDFPYFASLVRGAAAAVGYVDNAAAITHIDNIYDVGDGQGLMVNWGENIPGYSYQVLYGTSSGQYPVTLDVPAGQSHLFVNGLTTGQLYYFAVRGITPQGYGPISYDEKSECPLVVPRAPKNFMAEPDSAKVSLHWSPNIELDFDHYYINRRPEAGGDWEVIADAVIDTFYLDLAALPQTLYEYTVVAVDGSANESAPSVIGTAAAATFDGGVLLVDEYDSGVPSELQNVAAFYEELFDGIDYTKEQLSGYSDNLELTRSIAGQYNYIFWMDDDWNYNLFSYSQDSVDWFLGFQTAFCLSGYETIYYLTGQVPQFPGDFAYDHFGIRQLLYIPNADFVGAHGQGGWPDVTVNPLSDLGPRLPSVSLLDHLPNAEVIYTYDAFSNDPAREGHPVGVAFDNGTSRAIALTFPLYFLDVATAHQFILKALSYFAGEENYVPGDCNEDGIINVLDILFLVNYKFKEGPAPVHLNSADVNGDCIIDVLDILYLINFKFKNGPELLMGCVQ